MKIIPGMRFCVFISMVLGLAACGGGGGGGSSSGTPSTPEPPPAGELVVDPDGYGNRLAPMRSIQDLNASSALFSDIQAIETFINSVSDAISADVSAAGAVTAMAAAQCSDANNNLVVTDNRNSSGVGELLIEFIHCVVTVDQGDYVLNGTVRTVTQNLSGDRVRVTETYNVGGNELTGTGTGLPIELKGEQIITAQARSATDIEVVSETESLEFLRNNTYVAIRGSRIAIREAGDVLTLNIQSEIIGSSINGYLTLDTPQSIVAAVGATCPSSGRISVIGDGRIDSAFGSSNSRGSGVEVTIGDVTTYDATCGVGVPGVSDNLSATVNATSGASIRALAE